MEHFGKRVKIQNEHVPFLDRKRVFWILSFQTRSHSSYLHNVVWTFPLESSLSKCAILRLGKQGAPPWQNRDNGSRSTIPGCKESLARLGNREGLFVEQTENGSGGKGFTRGEGTASSRAGGVFILRQCLDILSCGGEACRFHSAITLWQSLTSPSGASTIFASLRGVRNLSTCIEP